MNLVNIAHDVARLGIAEAESLCLRQEQAACGVIHRFGPGVCIREVTIPAGTFAIGHKQRFEHMNVMLTGRVTMFNDDGSTTELVAPMQFVGKPGRKIGYVHEDMTWLNVYATNLTDADKVEAHFVEKSDAWNQSDEARRLAMLRTEDRQDYAQMLVETGFTDEQARAMSEDESDQIPFPHGSWRVRVGKSPIDGFGMFATAEIKAGELIAPASIGGKRTPAGRYPNHAKKPNARMVPAGDAINLVAMRDIAGCVGGFDGEEITVDYRQAMSVRKMLEAA